VQTHITKVQWAQKYSWDQATMEQRPFQLQQSTKQQRWGLVHKP